MQQRVRIAANCVVLVMRTGGAVCIRFSLDSPWAGMVFRSNRLTAHQLPLLSGHCPLIMQAGP
jgi:hypothetical protein